MGTSKKTGKGKTAGKRATRAPTEKKDTAKKEMNPAEVRKDLAKIVGSGAKKMVREVMKRAANGEVAPVKFLLEVAGVYPPITDDTFATDEEDCLAKTLLERLNITTVPVKLDEDEDDVVIPAGFKSETAAPTGESMETGPVEAERVPEV